MLVLMARITLEEARRIIKNGKTDEVAQMLVDGDAAEESKKAILTRGRSEKRLLAGMAAELGGAAVGGVAVGALKAYGHEEVLIPVAAGATLIGGYYRIKKPGEEVGEFLFSGGIGMTSALLAVEAENYFAQSKSAPQKAA